MQFDEKCVDEFWILRREPFEEWGGISQFADTSEPEQAIFLSHINKNLFSWGVIQKGELAAIGSFCLFTGIPYREVQFESV